MRFRKGPSDGAECRGREQHVPQIVQPDEEDAPESFRLYAPEHIINALVQTRASTLVCGRPPGASPTAPREDLMYSIVAEAERPGRSGRTTTSPPVFSTTPSSARRSPAWSPPFTCRSGLT